jgi:hypothetical protein
MTRRLFVRLFVALSISCIGVVMLVSFQRGDANVGVSSDVDRFLKVGIVTFSWLLIAWILISALVQLLIALSLISVTKGNKILRATLWVAAPLVVSHAVNPQAEINTSTIPTVKGDDRSTTSEVMAATIGAVSARALIELVDSKRHHKLRVGVVRGCRVVPDTLQSNMELQFRKAADQRNHLLEVELTPLNEIKQLASDIGELHLVNRDNSSLAVGRPKNPKFVIRLMGPVEVVTSNGDRVDFNRSKSVELLTWIAEHRSAPRRSLARSAMWDAGVQDATFNNVVSEVRRGLNSVVAEEQPWISRSYDDHLILSEEVQSDAQLLRDALSIYDEDPSESNLVDLKAALDLVRGLPFAGTKYLWPDTEGITTNIVITILEASETIATRALDENCIADVFWATGQGLRVVQGHEGLVALRMKAHAAKRTMAGLESEWRSYLRAVEVDSWSGGRPNPELVELHQMLRSL